MLNITYEQNYLINQNMMYLEEFYNHRGKLCTIVYELEQTLYVDRSPTEILNNSIRCIGFDLKGAVSTAKWIVGEKYMCPFMINPIKKICVLPHRSSKEGVTRYFNPVHIKRTGSFNRKTKIEFKNGQTLIIHVKVSTFNDKLKTAEQLREISVDIGKDPVSFIIDPQKKQMEFRKKEKEFKD